MTTKQRLLDARSWRFLNDPTRYVERYNQPDVPRRLQPQATARQMRTALEILGRMQSHAGVLLADDVGLGKTTVAALVACVFAGQGKKVRILAPNGAMERRWHEELTGHAAVLPHVTTLNPIRVARTVGKLRDGTIEVTTHFRGAHRNVLACDLLIVDEAHRAKGEGSYFAERLRSFKDSVGKILILTATPLSIRPSDLSRMLQLIDALEVPDIIDDCSRRLDDLWAGKFGSPDFADDLASSCKAAVEAIRPYVIRHSVEHLSHDERRLFGERETWRIETPPATADELAILLRADRLLGLGKRAGTWEMERTNDPRFHVGWTFLRERIKELSAKETETAMTPDVQAAHEHHLAALEKLLHRRRSHPKADAVTSAVAQVVEEGERVLLFCDHIATAQELAIALHAAIDVPEARRDAGGLDDEAVWRVAWRRVFQASADHEALGRSADAALDGLVAWLSSPGIRAQVLGWIRVVPGDPDLLVARLHAVRARAAPKGTKSIADEAIDLWHRIRDSSSSRAVFASSTKTSRFQAHLPGTAANASRVLATCEMPLRAPRIFWEGSPDAVLAIFNSPFGPDVLVATDKLSEGFDLHRFCRHVVHYELDPSPVRTVQRNGRVRRVDSWASRTGQKIRIAFPVFCGTRDERLVKTMRDRVDQFDLLLGGVGTSIEIDSDVEADRLRAEVLAKVKARLASLGRSLAVEVQA